MPERVLPGFFDMVTNQDWFNNALKERRDEVSELAGALLGAKNEIPQLALIQQREIDASINDVLDVLLPKAPAAEGSKNVMVETGTIRDKEREYPFFVVNGPRDEKDKPIVRYIVATRINRPLAESNGVDRVVHSGVIGFEERKKGKYGLMLPVGMQELRRANFAQQDRLHRAILFLAVTTVGKKITRDAEGRFERKVSSI